METRIVNNYSNMYFGAIKDKANKLKPIKRSIRYDSRGRLSSIGEEPVRYDSRGRLSSIGKQSVEYDSRGRICYIGGKAVEYDSRGRICYIDE